LKGYVVIVFLDTASNKDFMIFDILEPA